MSEAAVVIHTEVYGLELQLADSQLVLVSGGKSLTAPIVLGSEDADRLRMEMAKAHLPEWNEIESMKASVERRRRSYLGSWLVLCLAAFSAYIGYPSYAVPLFLSALSIFLWWRAGYQERQSEKQALAERNRFVPDWSYYQKRSEESTASGVG